MQTKKKKCYRPSIGDKFYFIYCGTEQIIYEEIWQDHDEYFYKDINFKIKYFPLGMYKTRRAAETALRRIKKFVKEEL